MANSDETDYICALTGLMASPATTVQDADDDDSLGDMPVGWTRVTIERRVPNPKHELLQQVMSQSVFQMLQAVAEEHRAAAKPQIELAIAAQYALLSDRTDAYLTESEVTYLAPPELDSGAAEGHAAFRKMLNLPEETPHEE